MKVQYKFLYKDKSGKVSEFSAPVNISESIDPDKMYDIFESYLKFFKIQGTPFQVASTEKGVPNFSFIEETQEKDRLIWARVSDDNDPEVSWVPAIVRNGKVLSAVGELSNPDSEEDIRDFDNCPIPGYTVQKIEQPKTPQTILGEIRLLLTPKNEFGVSRRTDVPYIGLYEFEDKGSYENNRNYLIDTFKSHIFGKYEASLISVAFTDVFPKNVIRKGIFGEAGIMDYKSEFFVIKFFYPSENIERELYYVPFLEEELISGKPNLSRVFEITGDIRINRITICNGTLKNKIVILGR